jgi:hypothetical protein
MAQGSRAAASDYNSIRTTIFNLMGVGSTTTGYGQPISANAVSAGAVITVSQWTTIESDLKKARQHQTGVAVTNGTASGSLMTQLQTVTPSTVVSESIRLQYQNFADGINALAERTKAAASQLTPGVALTTTTRSSGTNWGGAGLSASITHTVTITFNQYTSGSLTVSAANAIRCFFNAGGSIQVTSSRTGAAANTKDTDWTNMLSGFGTFTLSSNSSSINGTLNAGGTVGSSIGYFQLTGTPQTVLNQSSSVSKYAENRYRINASVVANVITLAITWLDNDAGDQTGSGAAVDEPVTGTIASTVTYTRPSGANVDIPAAAVSGSATAIST